LRKLSVMLMPVMEALGRRAYLLYEGAMPAGRTNVLFKSLKDSQFHPNIIYDIGANRGNWTKRVLLFYPDAKYYLFEPNDSLRYYSSKLLDRNSDIIWRNVGMSDAQGSAKFTLADRDVGSTFRYSPEQAAKFGHEQIEVGLTTIDAEIERNGGEVPAL